VLNLPYLGTTRDRSKTILREGDTQASGLQDTRHLWLIYRGADWTSLSQHHRARRDPRTRGRFETGYRSELADDPESKEGHVK
jgi:hypothetical protein